VTTTAGCSWSSGGSTLWLTVNGASTGSGTANYSLSANTLTSPRSATIVIAGVSITLTQGAAGLMPPNNLRIVR
jgi:hypothetical protein